MFFMVCATDGDVSGPATILGQVRFAEVLVGLGVPLALLLLLVALGVVLVLVLVGAGSARAVPARAAIARMRLFNCMMD